MAQTKSDIQFFIETVIPMIDPSSITWDKSCDLIGIIVKDGTRQDNYSARATCWYKSIANTTFARYSIFSGMKKVVSYETTIEGSLQDHKLLSFTIANGADKEIGSLTLYL